MNGATMTHKVTCADCGSPMQQKTSRFGPFWGCVRWPSCKGTHGAHPDGRPLGKPANAETREARIIAHEAFDKLWKNGRMSRREAYQWMSDVLVMTRKQAHIGRFTKEQCEKLVDAIVARGRK